MKQVNKSLIIVLLFFSFGISLTAAAPTRKTVESPLNKKQHEINAQAHWTSLHNNTTAAKAKAQNQELQIQESQELSTLIPATLISGYKSNKDSKSLDDFNFVRKNRMRAIKAEDKIMQRLDSITTSGYIKYPTAGYEKRVLYTYNDRNWVTGQEEYNWDINGEKWILMGDIDVEWYEGGLNDGLIKSWTQIFKTESGEMTSRDVYSYNHADNIDTIRWYQRASVNNWVLLLTEIYYRDKKGRNIEHVTLASDIMIAQSFTHGKVLNTFDSLDRLINVESYDYDLYDNKWTGKEKYEYTYWKNTKIASSNTGYTWNSSGEGSWEKYALMIVEFNEFMQLTRQCRGEWNGENFYGGTNSQTSFETILTYDPEGRKLSSIAYSPYVEPGGNKAMTIKDTLTWSITENGEERAEMIRTNAAGTNMNRTCIIYSKYHPEAIRIFEGSMYYVDLKDDIWEGGDWKEVEQYTKDYDEEGNIISEKNFTFEANPETSTLVKRGGIRIDIEYDTAGYLSYTKHYNGDFVNSETGEETWNLFRQKEYRYENGVEVLYKNYTGAGRSHNGFVSYEIKYNYEKELDDLVVFEGFYYNPLNSNTSTNSFWFKADTVINYIGNNSNNWLKAMYIYHYSETKRPDSININIKEPITIRFRQTKDNLWDTVYIYAWRDNDEPENFGAWPGVTSKKDADGWYTVNLPASEFEIGHVIFNNGAAREEAEQFDADNVTHKTACYEISLTAATEIDCEGAAIEELSKANSVKIYPNPATSNITIDLENIKNINVLNMGGKTVMNAGNSNVINVGKLPAGVYFIKIMQNTGVIKYSKFIKK